VNIDDFDDEDGGFLLAAFEKSNNVPAAVPRKGSAIWDSSESDLRRRVAPRKGLQTEDSLESGFAEKVASTKDLGLRRQPISGKRTTLASLDVNRPMPTAPVGDSHISPNFGPEGADNTGDGVKGREAGGYIRE
jgi:hypothetical protein